jgi:signal transduction histidine kinase
MALLRLRTQLLIATLLIICALTGGLLLIVRHTVRSGVDRQVRESTYGSLRAFENVQQQRQLELSRTTAMLAELPTLKALMTSDDAPTIQDASSTFLKLAGSDLLLLAGPDGQILGFHVAKPGWSPALIAADLKRSITRNEDPSWWYADGQLYWVFLRPISGGSGNNQKYLGYLAVGYQVDSSVADQLALVAGSKIALTVGGKVIASTFPVGEESELQSWILRQHPLSDSDGQPITLGSEDYQIAAVSLRDASPAPVTCYVLISLQRANGFIQWLNRVILFLGIGAIIFAAVTLTFVSHAITRPLDNLVAGVRAMAVGDYSYPITPRGSCEVAELGDAFSKMREEFKESQRRWLVTERMAALARASSSISHDLRHYLATIVANAEFLYENDRLKLNRDEIYAEIKTASEQMTDLLESLRDLAREGVGISPTYGALDQIIRRAIESVQSRPELRSVSISLKTSGEMSGMFDSKRMERALFNLLLNACEAAVTGQGRVDVDATRASEAFEIRVTDSGPGIPSAIRNSLFDPFVSWGKMNGTGMGLAIVNKLVQDHAGSVTVEKTSDAGTTFLIRLPRSLEAGGGQVLLASADGAIKKLP